MPNTRKNPTFTEYALVSLVAVVIGLAAVPRKQRHPEYLEAQVAIELHDRAEEFRAAVAAYRFDHLGPAGWERRPGTPGVLSVGAFRRQLLLRTDAEGNCGPGLMPVYEFGPYLDPIPTNPVNGLDTIRMLAVGEAFPEVADGSTGWIYSPWLGDLRPNSVGTAEGSDYSYYEL